MSIHLARVVVTDAARLLRYYAGWASKIEGRTIPSAARVTEGAESLTYTLREPVGVVGQIIPWNVPFSMACLKLAPALAAGCTVILKPAEETPLSAIFLARLIMQCGFPAGVINILNGVGEIAGAALARHPDIDKIAFTGSTEVGRSVIHAASGNLKKVSLELGGKSPVVVFPDANLARAIPGVAQAAFFLQGQNCMAGSRILVHSDIYDQVVEGVAAFAKALPIGPGLDPDSFIGPLISARHRDRVLGYIASGLMDGARLVAGGAAVDGPGFFLQPTVFADTNAGMSIVREEIFGPVMSIQRFSGDDLDEIAALANDSVFGLSGSVWTEKLSVAHAMVRRIRAGQVSINCHGAVDSNIPFGGFKQSGWGREFGAEGLDGYLETKAVTARL
jgi:phenylacetaldehyde dehydrogenase